MNRSIKNKSFSSCSASFHQPTRIKAKVEVDSNNQIQCTSKNYQNLLHRPLSLVWRGSKKKLDIHLQTTPFKTRECNKHITTVYEGDSSSSPTEIYLPQEKYKI